MHIDITEALTLLCVDDLKDLTRHLPGSPITGRKAELVDGIARVLLGSDLKSLWFGLKENQRAAVSEAVHDVLGEFSPATFQAKYGRALEFHASAGSARSYGPRKSTPVCLFIYRHAAEKNLGVPCDLRQRLLEFVPEPEVVKIKTQEQLDAAEDQFTRLAERDALYELTLMMRTIDSEPITVGEKTGQPSTAAQRLLAAKLPTGDFYPWVEKTDKWEQQVGPIKAFAWPLLLQAGGLANRTGTRLTLSPTGVKALSAAPTEVIRNLWRKWLKTSLFISVTSCALRSMRQISRNAAPVGSGAQLTK